jgi:hypothetical protein
MCVQQGDQFFESPDAVRQASLHLWRDVEGLMHAAEVVESKEYRNRVRVVLDLL